MKKYNKLVRDYIPAFIRAKGIKAVFKILEEEEYYEALVSKLSEEVQEFEESNELEELADILEVFEAILRARGSSLEEVRKIQLKKRLERGGFRDRLFLLEIEDKPEDKEADKA